MIVPRAAITESFNAPAPVQLIRASLRRLGLKRAEGSGPLEPFSACRQILRECGVFTCPRSAIAIVVVTVRQHRIYHSISWVWMAGEAEPAVRSGEIRGASLNEIPANP